MKELLELIKKSRGVSCTAQSIMPGMIFVAIHGRVTNGNLYARTAEDRGAIAVVSDNPSTLPPLNIPVFSAQNARHALSALAAAYYDYPSEKINITGVTGTNGKTTITFLLQQIFQHHGFKTGLIGTVFTDVGNAIYPSTLTTPEPVTLHKSFYQMLCNELTHAVMEVSAQGIEMNRTDHLRLNCGILSNISPDHLDFHQNFESYIAAKRKFIDLLPPEAPLIANVSDDICNQIAKDKQGELLTASLNGENALFVAEVKRLLPYSSRFTIHLTQPVKTKAGNTIMPISIPLFLPMPGIHNIENALLSTACAIWNEIDIKTIQNALACFHGVPRRMNIHHMQGITVIDDTALNPGSIDAVFSCIQNIKCQNIIVINAIRGHRGSEVNRINAQTLSKWQKHLLFHLIITASKELVDELNLVTAEEKQSFITSLNQSKTRYTYTDDLYDAVNTAKNTVKAGDVLVLLGAQGMDRGFEILTSQISSYRTSDSQLTTSEANA